MMLKMLFLIHTILVTGTDKVFQVFIPRFVAIGYKLSLENYMRIHLLLQAETFTKAL